MKPLLLCTGLFSALWRAVARVQPKRYALPRIIKFSQHPFTVRGHAKTLAGGGGGLLRLWTPFRGVMIASIAVLLTFAWFAHVSGMDPGVLLAMPALLTAKQLREKRANLAEQARAILAEAGDSDLSDEKRAEFDRLHDEIEDIGKRAERIERQEAIDRDLETPRPTQAGQQDRGGAGGESRDEPNVDAEQRAEQERVAFNAWARGGMGALTPEQREVMARRQTQLDPEQRALAAGTDAAGGFTVPEGFVNRIDQALKAFGGMRASRAEIMRTTSGNDMPYPTSDDTSNTGARVSENTQVTEQDVAFGAVVLKAWLYTSKIIRVPYTLLQDSAFDLETYLPERLGERIGRITNTEFTTGPDTSSPEGVAPASTNGKTGAVGQTTSIIYEDLVDLQHSVDPAYRRQAEWMFHDTTLKVLKKLKDADGRPLWQPGLAVREPDTILGHGYVVNQDVAVMAASAISLLFGDFSKYKIRDVRGITLLRLQERYADFLQVGFLAFSRHDGRLIDAGTNPIKHYANSAT